MKREEFLATLDIGMTIKKLREKKGLSQEQLAKDICDRTNITKLENGHSKVPSLSFVLSICERLEISIDEFLNYALTNNYKIDKKKVLTLLMTNNYAELEEYVHLLQSNKLSIMDRRYYDFLLAKIYLHTDKSKEAINLLKTLIKANKDDCIYFLAVHELVKSNNLKTDTIYNREFFNKIKNKNTPNEYLYFINDLLISAINDNNLMKAKYLLELEIEFINTHDLYKYLDIYYMNKIKIYHDEYKSINDIESKLLALQNKKATN